MQAIYAAFSKKTCFDAYILFGHAHQELPDPYLLSKLIEQKLELADLTQIYMQTHAHGSPESNEEISCIKAIEEMFKEMEAINITYLGTSCFGGINHDVLIRKNSAMFTCTDKEQVNIDSNFNYQKYTTLISQNIKNINAGIFQYFQEDFKGKNSMFSIKDLKQQYIKLTHYNDASSLLKNKDHNNDLNGKEVTDIQNQNEYKYEYQLLAEEAKTNQ
jgi:hypothetical protein